jgi:hypothetical protein
MSVAEHEKKWELAGQLRRELSDLREIIKRYADILALAAGVQPIGQSSAAVKK